MSMKFIKLMQCVALVVSMGYVAHAEVTEDFTLDPEDGNTSGSLNSPGTCKLKVTGNYNIRQGPSKSQDRCSVFEGPFNYDVTPLSLHSGGWVQFTSEQTKNCPGGSGWAHKNAFNDDDFESFNNGECGRAAIDQGRTPTPERGDTKVESTNSRGHQFPLDQCHGIKNDGGLGHYHAPRAAGHRHGGTDYYAPKGTLILSPCDGTVTNSYVGNVTGNLITIKCKNGDSFKMMHLHTRPQRAAKGVQVTKGQTVGGVGNTGNARRQAPHLHIEATIQGKRVDPQKLWSCSGDSGH